MAAAGMSLAVKVHRHGSDMRKNRNERRRQRPRYDIALSVRYIVSSQSLVRGTGELENISSAGLLFRCDGRVPVGSRILMEIDWPSRPRPAARWR